MLISKRVGVFSRMEINIFFYFQDRYRKYHSAIHHVCYQGGGGKELLFFNTLFFLYKIDLLILLRIKKMLISKRVGVFSRMPY